MPRASLRVRHWADEVGELVVAHRAGGVAQVHESAELHVALSRRKGPRHFTGGRREFRRGHDERAKEVLDPTRTDAARVMRRVPEDPARSRRHADPSEYRRMTMCEGS